MAAAYSQLELNKKSKKYVFSITHKGLNRVNRLAFGLACSPAIFKSVIEQVVAAITHTQLYLYDIVVTRASAGENLENLPQCLSRMRTAEIRLRCKKCLLVTDEIVHLGHVLDRRGVRVKNNKVFAIRAALAF